MYFFFLICGTVFNFAELWWAMMIDSKMQHTVLQPLIWGFTNVVIHEIIIMITIVGQGSCVLISFPNGKLTEMNFEFWICDGILFYMILTFSFPLYPAVYIQIKQILQRQHSCLTNSLHLHLQTLISVHKDNYPAGTGGYPDTLREVLKIFFSDPLFFFFFNASLKRSELVSYRVYSGKMVLQIYLWKKIWFWKL